MSDCPSDTELAEFLGDTLAPDRVGQLAAHLESCPGCRRRLGELRPAAAAGSGRGNPAVPPNPPDETLAEPPTAGSFSEARTLVWGSNTPLLIPHPRPAGLPEVPGFELLGEIGRGGMGVVYKARHRRLNRLVALKMVLAGAAADPRTVQRFLFEAEILARVQHPQVVQVFEVDTYHGPGGVPVPYLAIELLEGGSLSKRLRGGPLGTRAAAELVEGVARAVHAVHAQGVIHRDLKPGNILFPESGVRSQESGDRRQETGIAALPESSVTPDSCLLTPKVTDFGLAKFTQDGADLTASGQVVGTPHYMAPEQAAGSKQVGPAADVYSLGAILFECLTGRPPFPGDEPMSVLVRVVTEPPPDVRAARPDVPRDLGAVVARCLEKDPRRRYAGADELADDLRRFLDNRPTRARPHTARERFWLWTKRNPAVAGLLAALAAVLLVAFAAVTWLWVEARDTARKERLAKEQAERAEWGAKQAHDETTLALDKARKSEGQALAAEKKATEALALLEFERAMEWCEEGRIRQGLEQFVRTVELAEATGAGELARVARANLAAWPRELPRPRKPFPHAQQPRLAAFLPDGTHMVTAGRGSAVHLWNTRTGGKVRTYRPAIAKPFHRLTGVTYWTVAVSADGRALAAGSSDGHVTVWNTDAPEPRLSFDALVAEENVWAVAFAPDGTLWANDGRRGLKRWDVSGARPVELAHAVPAPGAPAGVLQVLAVSADGQRLYSGDRAGMVREWDAASAAELRRWNAGGWVQDLALSPDGTRVAATGPEGIVRVIDLAAGRVALDIPLAAAYGNGVAFAPHAPYLLTSDGDGNVRTWHRDTGMPVGLPMRFTGEVTRLRFRPGSDEFAVPAGNSVYLCRAPDPPLDVVSAGYGRRVRGLDVSPAGDRVAVSDDDGFELFDAHTARRLQRVEYRPRWPHFRRQEPPLTVRFDPDPGRPRVLRGTRVGLDLLPVPDGGPARPVKSLGLGWVRRVEFLPGGRAFLAADDDALARFDAATLRQAALAPVERLPPGVEIHALAARPDGREVLVGYGSRVAFLDPETLKPTRPGWSTGDDVLDARYTPDGSKVLVGRRDNRAELRDALTGEPVVPAMPHAKAVLAVAVSPDGTVLLTASRDGTARFWDAATGLPLGAPLRHLGPVTHAVYTPDGEHALTGTGTGHVVLWDVPPPPARGSVAELLAATERDE
jgi:serine/threonine protein kinase/WD40 repeat protein